MKILVIFTGGTIGSEASGEYISIDGIKPYKLLQMYADAYPDEARDVRFDTESPYTVLSENADGNTFKKLFDAVSQGVDAGYDGIIVTHGSDTLQYGAAVAAYAAGCDSIPVIMVASNYVLEDGRSNGRVNFRSAVLFIKGRYGTGAYAAYANRGGRCRIHCALELMPHGMFDDSLHSVNEEYYGEFDDGRFIRTNHACPKYGRIQETPETPDGCIGIMCMSVHPGMVCPEITDSVIAVIIESYHSGTVCTDYRPFCEMLEKAAMLSIPVYLVGAYEGQDYESCAAYKHMGIRVLSKIPQAVAYVGIWLGVI